MKHKITLTDEVQYLIEAEAINSYPHECCGFLYGTDENEANS